MLLIAKQKLEGISPFSPNVTVKGSAITRSTVTHTYNPGTWEAEAGR